jgi:hypothetical protein
MQRISIDVAIVNFRDVADTLQTLRHLGNWPHGTVWVVDNSAHEVDIADSTARFAKGLRYQPLGTTVDSRHQPWIWARM